MAARSDLIAEVRTKGSTEPVPEGWVAEPLVWRGQEMEVAYDPSKVSVVVVEPRLMDQDDLRRKVTQAGWRRIATDEEGVELWLADVEDVPASQLGPAATWRRILGDGDRGIWSTAPRMRAEAQLDQLSRTASRSAEQETPGIS